VILAKPEDSRSDIQDSQEALDGSNRLASIHPPEFKSVNHPAHEAPRPSPQAYKTILVLSGKFKSGKAGCTCGLAVAAFCRSISS
jgi:hypothetical protein